MAYDNINREIGGLVADVAAIKTQMQSMRDELRETRDAVLKAQGGWRVMGTLAGIAGGVSGFVLALVRMKLGS